MTLLVLIISAMALGAKVLGAIVGRSRLMHEPRAVRLLEAGSARWCKWCRAEVCRCELPIASGYVRPAPTSMPGPGESVSR
jgi:hypothetical protein